MLGINCSDIVLNQTEDLGDQFLHAGKHLALAYHRHDLARICFETASLLGSDGAETVASVGADLVRAKDIGVGVEFLEQACRMAPQDTKIHAIMDEAAKALENDVGVNVHRGVTNAG
jgi:hypothetical protein